MLEAHTGAAADSVYVGSEEVGMRTLDSLTVEYAQDTDRILLKIDTQGSEWQILDGGANTLRRVQGILCELSFVPLYTGERLWQDMIARLAHEGFALWSLSSAFVDPRNGRMLQGDALFFRV
jgi:hypothetical protein